MVCNSRKAIFKNNWLDCTYVPDHTYVEKKYLKAKSLEARDYQINLARHAASENCLVVLPTGLGKTAVAAHLIAEFLSHNTGASLILAPTRVLVEQHYQFMQNHLSVDDVALITGEETVSRRSKMWPNSVVCATPEITKNDLLRGIVSPADFNLVIFDEAHRAVGNYAYTAIAENFANSSTRLVGMTATLPDEKSKIDEIIGAIGAQSIESRTENSDDVKAYVQKTNTEMVSLKLPDNMIAIQQLIKRALAERYAALKSMGLDAGSNRSLSALLRLRMFVLSHRKNAIQPLFSAIRITYALNIFEAHGVTTFLKFCERAAKKSAVARALVGSDENFSKAVAQARALQKQGIEHPKIARTLELLSGSDEKVIIFSSYRDSVAVIRDKLRNAGISAESLIGKAGESGLKQKKQIETVARFREGDYRALVTTRVGEEGLDISSVNLVIFYDSVPSSIRYIQRKGRTGRHSTGRLVSLVTKGTIDVAYHWIGRRKIKASQKANASVSIQKKTKPVPVPRRKRKVSSLDDFN